MIKTIFGWVASSITVVYKIPQIIKLYKTKKSSDLSILSLIIQSIGYIFYILHGFNINDLPIISMGVGALIQNIIIIILYYLYNNNETIPT